MLLNTDIKKLVAMASWADEDLETLEDMLKFAGTDIDAKYEHFDLVGAKQDLKMCIEKIRRVITKFEDRTNTKINYSKTSDRAEKTQGATATYVTPKTTTVVTPSKFKDGLLVDKDELTKVIREVCAAYPDRVTQASDGVNGHLGFLTGKISVASGGKADPNVVLELLGEYIFLGDIELEGDEVVEAEVVTS